MSLDRSCFDCDHRDFGGVLVCNTGFPSQKNLHRDGALYYGVSRLFLFLLSNTEISSVSFR